MGRQIQLSMLPADRDALLEQIQRDENVMVLLRDGDSQTVHPLSTIPEKIPGTLILCHREFTPTLERKLIASATPPYYRVDDFELPVLEFSDSLLTEWEKRPALTQGRIYGQFTGKSLQFARWFEHIARYVRKHWSKSPVSLLGGYVGPATSQWFDSGGLLLPMFVPPTTIDWLRLIDQQHSAALKG